MATQCESTSRWGPIIYYKYIKNYNINGNVKSEEIFSLLKTKRKIVSRATIYRTLDVLVKNRLIRKMDVGDGYSLYEPRVDNDHHDHMICEDTGDIIEFFSEALELLQEKIARDHGYPVIRHTHQLFVKKI